MLEAADGAVVGELAYLSNMVVVGQDCSIHLVQGNMGFAVAAVVAVDEKGTLDVVDTGDGVDRGSGVGEWVVGEDMRMR